MALQTVQYNAHFVSANPGPVQINKIMIRGRYPFPNIADVSDLSKKGRIDGLNMRVFE
jgi:hypothetical protein